MALAKKELRREKEELKEHISELLADKKRWGVAASVRQLEKEPTNDVVENVLLFREHGVKRIMDVGCGWGRNTAFLSREGFEVIGVDFTQRALKIFKRRVEREKLENVSIIEGSVAEIPVKDASVDAVLSHFVLMHLSSEDKKGLANEIDRILKPGGIALITESMPKNEIEELFKDFRLISLKEMYRTIAGTQLPYWSLVAEKKAEPVKDGIETQAGIVKLREEPSFGDVKSYGIILEQSDSPEERKIGSVYVILPKLENTPIPLQARNTLMKEDLRKDDVIAEIFGFTPFGELTGTLTAEEEKAVEEKFMRKGVGTAAMSLLLDDLKNKGFSGVYVRTISKEKMPGLLEKFEFQEIAENCYFKKF